MEVLRTVLICGTVVASMLIGRSTLIIVMGDVTHDPIAQRISAIAGSDGRINTTDEIALANKLLDN